MQNLAVAPGGAISRAEVPLRFGLFEADLQLLELRKQGRRIRLQTQPFQVLEALLEHPGHVVTREELRRRLWPEDTFVDFDHSLNTAVRRLREALGDSPENPIFIETLQRRGYRFIAPVVESVLTPEPIGAFPMAEMSTSNHERSTASPEPWSSPAHRPESGLLCGQTCSSYSVGWWRGQSSLWPLCILGRIQETQSQVPDPNPCDRLPSFRWRISRPIPHRNICRME